MKNSQILALQELSYSLFVILALVFFKAPILGFLVIFKNFVETTVKWGGIM